MRIITQLITILILTSCTSLGSHSNDPPFYKMADSLLKQSIEKLSKKYQIQPFGVKEGMMKCVTFMGLRFQINRPLSKNEARELIVNATQDFLNDINQNKEIRQYLEVFPFDLKHIDLDIFIRTSENGTFYHPNLSVVSAFEGNIDYSTNDPDKRFHYKVEESESFEDAIKILKGELPIPPSQIN